MTFPLKSRYVKSSLKTDARSASPVPCSQARVPNNQLPPGRIPRLNCICFLAPGSHRPAAAERPTAQLRVARRTREVTRLRTNSNTCWKTDSPATVLPLSKCLVAWSSASRRERATGTLSRVRMRGEKSGWQRCWEVWKFWNPNTGFT